MRRCDGQEPAGRSPRPGKPSRELPTPAGRLGSRSLRDRLFAPELLRYLGHEGIDLAAVDQLEALEVRVAHGLEVLEGRIATTRSAALRSRDRWRRAAPIGALVALASLALELLIPPGAALAGGALALSGALTALALGAARERDLRRLEDLERAGRNLAETPPGEFPRLLARSRELFDRIAVLAGRARNRRSGQLSS